MTEIIFTTRQQVINFLKSRNQEDCEIRWTCPECKTVNLGAYYSHVSPCGGCKEFVFPRLNLSKLLEDASEVAELAKYRNSLIARIDRKKEIASDLRSELADEESEIRELKDELRQLEKCNVEQVKW
jgi:hypothetical protein